MCNFSVDLEKRISDTVETSKGYPEYEQLVSDCNAFTEEYRKILEVLTPMQRRSLDRFVSANANLRHWLLETAYEDALREFYDKIQEIQNHKYTRRRNKMFIYDHHRFHFGNVSFALPSGIYLMDQEEETQGQIRIALPGEAWYISIFCMESENGAAHFFDTELDSEILDWIGKARPVSYGGLDGYVLQYKCGEYQYCEYHLDMEVDGDPNVFTILVQADGETADDMDTIIRHRMVKKLLNSIRKEQ